MSQRTTLVFSPANGFPAGSYRKLFGFLEQDYDILYIDRIGHDPRYPVSDGWPHRVAELADFIAARAAGPVVGVGHSLGRYLSFLAAVAIRRMLTGLRTGPHGESVVPHNRLQGTA